MNDTTGMTEDEPQDQATLLSLLCPSVSFPARAILLYCSHLESPRIAAFVPHQEATPHLKSSAYLLGTRYAHHACTGGRGFLP
jgi:hypothetical protein